MNILLFAGTTEGRRLAEALRKHPVRATICVATEYGGETLGPMPERFTVSIGRMDAEAMLALLRSGSFDLVVDATHPYATAVSENIRTACEQVGAPRLRLVREKSPARDCLRVDSAAAAAAALAGTEGAVLLTTGAKELAAFAAVPDYAGRMYPRVLPSMESIRACEELGYKRSHIIAMQGPFSRELNLALMRQFNIRHLATKDGGEAGGFLAKMQAAEDAGVRAVVIGRPTEEEGCDLRKVLDIITEKGKA